MNLIKNFRLIVFIVLVLISLYFTISSIFFIKPGVIVESISDINRCNNVREGYLVTKILDYQIKNVEDFKFVEKSLKAGQYITIVANNMPGGCTVVDDGSLGMSVKDSSFKKINFGMDIQGGITIILKPEKNISLTELNKVVEIIKKRINFLRLPETYVSSSDNTIKVSTSLSSIDQIIKNCKFETEIEQKIEIKNGTGNIKFEHESYPIEFLNDSFKFNDSIYKINESFYIDGVKFYLKNITNVSAVLLSSFFTGDDVVNVLNQYSYVRYEKGVGTYVVNIPVEISPETSDKFKKITSGIGSTIVGNQAILNANLLFYLDGQMVSRLNIPYQFVLQKIQTISIIGFEKSYSEAQNLRSTISMCLNSGKLSTNLEKSGIEKLKPKYENLMKNVIIVFVIIFFILNLTLFHFRYKNLKIGMLSLILSFGECLIIFSIILFLQTSLIQNLVIDLVSIAGMFIVTYVILIRFFIISEDIVYGKKITFMKKITIGLVLIAFILLFSSFKLLGIIFLIDFLIEKTIVSPVFKRAF